MSRAWSLASRWLPVLGWMILIFIASADTESGNRGSRILGPILRWFMPDISPVDLAQAVLIARKWVHFGTFGILAALLFRALSDRPGTAVLASTAWKAWGFTVLYALSDEAHQTFVPSRVGSLWDVAIDALGAAFAVWILRRWSRRPRPR